MTNPLLVELNTYPPSGKMIHREVVDPKAEIKEYRTTIVDDPDATPWRIVDGVACRRVGHGVNANAAKIESSSPVGVRQQRQKYEDRRGRPRVHRRDAESSVQETTSESQTEEVTTHASDS